MRATLLLSAALILATGTAYAAEPDNLTLPAGFHATVVADGIKGLRHLAAAPSGDLYATTRDGLVALKLDKDHKAGDPRLFNKDAGKGTGIRLYHGALYAASVTGIYRIKLGKDLVPSATAELVVDGMPSGGFNNRPIAFDTAGNLYVGVGGTGNTCTATTPKGAKPMGLTPCPGVQDRGGIWKFKADKLGQKFPADGVQVATGLRDMDALDYHNGDGLYAIMHNRNGTHAQFPDVVSADDDDAIAEEMDRVSGPGIKGMVNMGWPWTYWDGKQKIRLMAPEYGGNDKTQPPAGMYVTPAVDFFPSHAPLDLMFYSGKQFPAHYRGGAFVVLHGGNGGHAAAGGYDVEYVPFTGNKAGAAEVFASGFEGEGGKVPNKASFRPVGGAVGADGSLYIADSQKGRIWRISYSGK